MKIKTTQLRLLRLFLIFPAFGWAVCMIEQVSAGENVGN
jgi:hypothetical protein